MRAQVDGREAYAYTGARGLVPSQRTLAFVHGAASDHSVWSLQSRYFAHHGWNVLAFDLPGHGRSEGPALPSVEALIYPDLKTAPWMDRAVQKIRISGI